MTTQFTSAFARHIEAMLDLRDSLGRARSNLEYQLRRFDRYAATHYPHQSVLTGELATGWVQDGKPGSGQPLDKARAIRAFGLYLNSVGVVDAFVLPGLWVKQAHAKLPHLFTDVELVAFFTGCDKLGPSGRDPLRGVKAAVIFRLMLACGLRPQEARRLRRTDVQLDTMVVTINASKGNKDRRVPFDEPTRRLLANYDRIANAHLPGRDWFFQAHTGGPHPASWLNTQYQRCRILGGGVAPGSVPYTLRHNHATRVLTGWVEQGEDLGNKLAYLSAYLGHDDYKATAYYIHLLPARISATGLTSIAAVIPQVL